MSNEMIPVDLKSLPANPMASDEVFGEIAKGSQFLPRLQLFSSGTKECKSGKVPMNHYGLVTGKDQIKVLGKTVEVFAFRWRPKALQVMDDGSVISVYDPKDAEFKRIATQSEVKDSGCMFGPEFLVWIPELSRFASFYMSSKSARIEAPNLKDAMDEEKPVTLSSVFVETKKYSWQAPKVEGCSTMPSNVPSAEAILSEIERFQNPPVNEVEAVDPVGAGTQRAR